jgi:YfiH family protein
MDFISADWPAPKRVRTMVTQRTHGTSLSPYDSLNLGDHVGDDPNAVLLNRQLLRAVLPSEPLWMRQTHGTLVSLSLSGVRESLVSDADAAVTNRANEVLAVLTADCLPVFFCSADGKQIGVAHAGWRGLCAGILENTVSALIQQSVGLTPSALLAWLGPAIGQNHFEVGKEVLESFAQRDFEINPQTFQPILQKPGKYLANLDLLAHQALKRAGVQNVYGGGLCTYTQSSQYFSHRRDGVSGRFASLIWIEP